MTARLSPRATSWSLAAVLLLAGAGVVRHQHAQAARYRGWARRVEADLAAVQSLDETVQSLDARLAALPAADAPGVPANPHQTLAPLDLPALPRLTERPGHDEDRPWRTVGYRLTFEPMDVADAVAALEALEGEDPPWRVEALTLRPGPRMNQVAVEAEVRGARAP